MQTRKIFYFAYIQPHLDYCSSAWGHCAPSHLKRLHSLQKRALKSILCENVPDSSTLFERLNILPVDKKIIFNDCALVHKVISDKVPLYIIKLLRKQTASYFEGKNRFILPDVYMDIFKMSFSYKGAETWNKLPLNLRKLVDPNNFKKSMLNYLWQ